ncbi:MAG: ABC transporter substrate-binding protein [Opitutaceae bacterium]|nr:ABC transporter substrate-binding protein [Opitutaceae bacterium]
MPSLPRTVLIGLVLVGAILAAGCTRQKRPANPTGTPALRKVVLQTDWFPQAEHGGYYQALVKGFYEQAGLDVEILPGGPGAGIKLKVATGDADFGMYRSDDVLMAAAAGLPLIMVSATMQRDPQALMVHASSPVKTFKDLDGRTIIASVSMTWIPYMKKKFGINFELRPNTYGLGEFLANPEAIQQCLVTNEPFFAEQHGRRVRTLQLAGTGYDSYQVIMCRRELVREAPDVVRAFVHASIRGWRDYLEGEPGRADAMILQRNENMTAGMLKFSRDEMILRRLVHGDPAKGERIGHLSLARITAQMQQLLELKVLSAPVAISSVATTQFIPATTP